MPTALLAALRQELKRVADPTRAPKMQAYMKSEMAYHGVPAPQARLVFRQIFNDVTFAHEGEWREQVLSLWRGAEFREERYGAIELTGHRRAKPYQTPAALDLYGEMISTGAWWDYVDWIATHRVAHLFAHHTDAVRPELLRWSRGSDLWKARSAIICQAHRRAATDLDFLERAMEPSLGARDFFLRKAIGWALRELAKANPEWVKAYVSDHLEALSPLSRKEALRRLIAAGDAAAIALETKARERAPLRRRSPR